uniref:Transducer of regulated CREB activity N-terminal domain-containing protein n=1 Tax=Parascaris univalens TaxID=6257 RepID=A0A915ACE8_PARUN
MAQGTPRKFSEKIAIMERKQNEDQEAFTSVMRDVRAITSTSAAASPICSSPGALAPPLHWNRPGGSLPNVHEMVQQPAQNWPFWPTQSVPHPSRGRSPGAHYHPYKQTKPQERVPPLDYHHVPYPPGNHLQPPDAMWPKARSDPAIHMNVYQQQRTPNFVMQELASQQPLQAPMSSFQPSAQLFIGAQQRPPRDDVVVGSLPNIPGPAPPCAYHQPIGQRHSMGVCQTLTTPPSMPESQSAPTSPAQSAELPAPPSWPPLRNYSNSPESLEIPNIVLTGTDGQLDCFQDLQDLHLDATELQQLLNSGEHVDPACETQLLD